MVGKAKGSPKTGGRKAGTRNKRTLLAGEILADIKHKVNSKRSTTGYCPIAMQVMFIERAFDIFENLPPEQGGEYLRLAMQANGKLMDKIHGNIEIQKTESSITAEEIVALMGEVEMIKDYKPIDDPESGLQKDDEDDL